MLPALATTGDAESFGLTVTDAALLRASTRVRSFVGQQISDGTSTVTARGTLVRLPQRPVRSITSVVDEDDNPVEYTLSGGGVLEVQDRCEVTIEYVHGFEDGTMPDELVEVVCTIAARLESVDPALASGVTQEQSGSASQTFGWDAWKAQSSLTAEEKAVLTRLFPRVPRTFVMVP